MYKRKRSIEKKRNKRDSRSTYQGELQVSKHKINSVRKKGFDHVSISAKAKICWECCSLELIRNRDAIEIPKYSSHTRVFKSIQASKRQVFKRNASEILAPVRRMQNVTYTWSFQACSGIQTRLIQVEFGKTDRTQIGYSLSTSSHECLESVSECFSLLIRSVIGRYMAFSQCVQRKSTETITMP